MTDIKKTIKEVNDIITYLKTKVDTTSTYDTPADKTAWEKRIKELTTNDASQELSLKGLVEFKDNLAQEITKHIQEKTQLKAAKRQVETERDDKQATITTKEAELAQKEIELQVKINEIAGLKDAKITKDLVDKLDALSGDSTKIAEVKTSLEEMKNALEAVKESGEKLPNWAGYTGFAVSILSFLIVSYKAFFGNNKKEETIIIE